MVTGRASPRRRLTLALRSAPTMSATLPAESGVVAEPADERPRLPRAGIGWTIALAVLLVGTAVLMFHLTHRLTFALDEWRLVTERRGAGAPSLLEPHNEHLSVLLLAPYIALLDLGGLDAYWVVMLPLVALQLTLGVLLFVIARRRVGAGVAVSVAAFALLCGLAYENFIIAGQAGQMLSIVAGVAAFAILDLPATRRNDRWLAALMVAALASSGMGIPVALGIAVELLLSAEGRRRLWVVALPFALYLVWYLFYGVTRASTDELALSALWAWTAADHAAGAIIGEPQVEAGRNLLILMLVIIGYRVWRIERAGRVRLAALSVVLLTFYGLTAISRHDIAVPESSRYLTVGLVFLLLMCVEAARGWRIRRWVPWVMIVIAWLAFAKAGGNAREFHDARVRFLDRSERLRASLGAVELLGRARVRADFEIAPNLAPFLEAGGWFAARADLRGNPADDAAEIARGRREVRAAADDTLVRGGGVGLGPPRATVATCRRPWPGDSGVVPAGGVRVEAGAARLWLRARRFGEDWQTVGVLPLPPGRAADLHPLRDAARQGYQLQATGARRICRLAG
jgi:hypothetical protein